MGISIHNRRTRRTLISAGDPRIALILMMALTLVTGIVDAVGYLGLDRVFVGNMTGNVVILGMGLAGADELPVLGPAIALITFTVAAFLVGLLLKTQPKGWSGQITVALAVGSAIQFVCGAALFVPGAGADSVWQVIIAAATAASMGLQAASARKIAVPDMTTVVVTSTLTSLASESWMTGGRGIVWNRRFGAIATLLLGAVIGAALVRAAHPGTAMMLAACLSAGVTMMGHIYVRGPGT